MRISRDCYKEDTRLKDESIFNCSSGKLGVRGCFEEGNPQDTISIRGTYINGFCEVEGINYNEKLYGFPDDKQTIVNLPDAQGIEIWVEGEKICGWSKQVKDYNYYLDMEKGVVRREFVYDTGKGDIKLVYERFTSFNRPNLFVIRCVVDSISYNGQIKIRSSLQGSVKNFTVVGDPRVASGSGVMTKVNNAENIELSEFENCKKLQTVEIETINSHRKVSVIVANDIKKVKGDIEKVPAEYEKEGALLTATKTLKLNKDEEVIIDKYCYYHEIPDEVDGIKDLLVAYQMGFDVLKEEQIKYVSDFWKTSRVIIDSDEVKQSHLDYCLYELLSAAGKDGKTSTAAKGLSGEGYEGHYFWDCETYIFPFFVVTNPEIAKSLLLYRYSKLNEAKHHAKMMGHSKGALFPWRTITGSECSSYYPSGSAQYHINGDIARAYSQYWNVTHDTKILPEICELLLETARLWMDVGYFNDGLFRIDCVTGPDEYTCMVNNNYYTNAGAANNLYYAAKLIEELKKTPRFDEFVKKTKVNDEELASFKEAASKMYYPYDEKLDIIKQDDSFLDKKVLEIDSIPKENFPLLLHYHPLFLNRHQVCKQADAVLADYMFANLKSSTSMKTYEYYKKVTTHDSSLSKAIFGIVATRLGNANESKECFLNTLSTDLEDNKGNTRDGLHLANMGGCYLMVTDGFAGMKINENGLSLFPMLPSGFKSYSFPIVFRGKHILVSVNDKGTKLNINKEDLTNPIDIEVYGQNIKLDKEEIEVIRTCKAVIFDLDGVITDTAVYHYQAWKKIADELNVPFDEKRNENFKGVSRNTCLELLLEWGNIKKSEEEFNALLERKNNFYKELLNNLTPDSILPGVLDALSTLRKNGIRIALFSVSKNTDAILDRLNIRDAFDVIVSGKDVKKSKPNFEGYLLAADRMNIEPRLCVMVEDSEAGINGAKALSMKTVAIMKENKANATFCIPSTKDLDKIMNYL